MDFLNGLLGDGNAWTLIISGIFGFLSLLLGAKWKQIRKEFKEFGIAVSELIVLVANMPERPSAAYLKKVKKEAQDVVKEFQDIVEIFKKKKDEQKS